MLGCFLFFVSNAAEHLPVKAPSLLLPSGVQTVKVLLTGDDLQLECIPGGMYVDFQHKCNAQISVCLSSLSLFPFVVPSQA